MSTHPKKQRGPHPSRHHCHPNRNLPPPPTTWALHSMSHARCFIGDLPIMAYICPYHYNSYVTWVVFCIPYIQITRVLNFTQTPVKKVFWSLSQSKTPESVPTKRPPGFKKGAANFFASCTEENLKSHWIWNLMKDTPNTLKLTASLRLKTDGWNTKLISFWET